MFLSPVQVVSQFSAASGARVADFGSGTGAHALLLSERVGDNGAVYAFDINAEGVECLAREKSKRGLRNLFSIRTDLNQRVPLRDGILTAALVSNVLHALTEREAFIRELNRVLEESGSVMFVDWAHSFRNMGPAESAVVYPSDGVRLFEENGFSVGAMLPAGTHHYAFIARKAV